ncbi:3'-5' exonuclease [Draconibacterium sediminis]|uniref:3'-5' exonuclease n=1 Tax=Draconibacterium sediminis TaxID=1544798 RepID=UPI0026EA6011|nr:3'-5' exonuclease [Draconibacterium sediminis]
MYLFFDTETTGLPRNWKAPVTDLNNWPRMVQIAWILCDNTGKRLDTKTYIIKPENYTIPRDASNVHGITTERAIAEGQDLSAVLQEFDGFVDQSNFIVAHNISFDEKIIGAEFLRKNVRTDFGRRRKLCTMQASTNYCRIPGYYGYKWPTLSELHIKLFGTDFTGAHDAFADIDATEKCFWEMKKIGII